MEIQGIHPVFLCRYSPIDNQLGECAGNPLSAGVAAAAGRKFGWAPPAHFIGSERRLCTGRGRPAVLNGGLRKSP